MKLKKRYILISIWILLIWALLLYFIERQDYTCPTWEVVILNSCSCRYECKPENYIGWTCDRVCPQEMKFYK